MSEWMRNNRLRDFFLYILYYSRDCIVTRLCVREIFLNHPNSGILSFSRYIWKKSILFSVVVMTKILYWVGTKKVKLWWRYNMLRNQVKLYTYIYIVFAAGNCLYAIHKVEEKKSTTALAKKKIFMPCKASFFSLMTFSF